MNVPDLDIVQIRDPAAYRDACVRNEEIDEWRRRRVADRMEVGRKIYGEMLRRLAEEEERWVHGLGRVVAVADRCPTNGADDLVRWLETGESPPSSDPGRAAWDKRVQRARAWVSARLPTEFRPYLKRRVRPPRPTERQAYLRACEEIGPGGTHFYGQAIETIRWQCYDQIIVSADFAGLVERGSSYRRARDRGETK